MVYGNEKAILETEKLKLATNDHYHKLLGYLYETVDLDKAIEHYSLALQYIKTKAVKNDLIKKIEQLKR